MKTILKLFLVTLVTAQFAQADWRPNWERPIFNAMLTELDFLGHEINVGLNKSLTMNKRDGMRDATSFTFAEDAQVFCITAPCPPIRMTTQFKQVQKRPAGCGSVKYTAYEAPVFSNPNQRLMPRRVLEVVDHSNRLCTDYHKYAWEVTLTTPGAHTQRTLFGTPEPVYTPEFH